MEYRTRIGRLADSAFILTALYAALALFFAARLRNAVQGGLLALPITALLAYAWRLWRRRGEAGRSAVENGKWQLHNLMLQPLPIALRTAAERVGARYGISALREQGDYIAGMLDGRQISITLLQRPLSAKVNSAAILALYHASCAEQMIVLSTAPFETEAAIFARQLRNPAIALLGPDQLEPLLRSLPRDDEARARDKKKRRWATFAQLRERAGNPERIRRYLVYGMLLLLGYIAFGLWPLLIPGLACIFLAVIARRNDAVAHPLFSEN